MTERLSPQTPSNLRYDVNKIICGPYQTNAQTLEPLIENHHIINSFLGNTELLAAASLINTCGTALSTYALTDPKFAPAFGIFAVLAQWGRVMESRAANKNGALSELVLEEILSNVGPFESSIESVLGNAGFTPDEINLRSLPHNEYNAQLAHIQIKLAQRILSPIGIGGAMFAGHEILLGGITAGLGLSSVPIGDYFYTKYKYRTAKKRVAQAAGDQSLSRALVDQHVNMSTVINTISASGDIVFAGVNLVTPHNPHKSAIQRGISSSVSGLTGPLNFSRDREVYMRHTQFMKHTIETITSGSFIATQERLKQHVERDGVHVLLHPEITDGVIIEDFKPIVPFGDALEIEPFSLSIKKGEIVILRVNSKEGASGTGKSLIGQALKHKLEHQGIFYTVTDGKATDIHERKTHEEIGQHVLLITKEGAKKKERIVDKFRYFFEQKHQSLLNEHMQKYEPSLVRLAWYTLDNLLEDQILKITLGKSIFPKKMQNDLESLRVIRNDWMQELLTDYGGNLSRKRIKPNRTLSSLSKGEESSVIFLEGECAIRFTNAELVIFDEPSEGLDDDNRKRLFSRLRKVQNSDAASSILVITHDNLDEIQKVIPEIRVVYLEEEKKEETKEPVLNFLNTPISIIEGEKILSVDQDTYAAFQKESEQDTPPLIIGENTFRLERRSTSEIQEQSLSFITYLLDIGYDKTLFAKLQEAGNVHFQYDEKHKRWVSDKPQIWLVYDDITTSLDLLVSEEEQLFESVIAYSPYSNVSIVPLSETDTLVATGIRPDDAIVLKPNFADDRVKRAYTKLTHAGIVKINAFGEMARQRRLRELLLYPHIASPIMLYFSEEDFRLDTLTTLLNEQLSRSTDNVLFIKDPEEDGNKRQAIIRKVPEANEYAITIFSFHDRTPHKVNISEENMTEEVIQALFINCGYSSESNFWQKHGFEPGRKNLQIGSKQVSFTLHIGNKNHYVWQANEVIDDYTQPECQITPINDFKQFLKDSLPGTKKPKRTAKVYHKIQRVMDDIVQTMYGHGKQSMGRKVMGYDKGITFLLGLDHDDDEHHTFMPFCTQVRDMDPIPELIKQQMTIVMRRRNTFLSLQEGTLVEFPNTGIIAKNAEQPRNNTLRSLIIAFEALRQGKCSEKHIYQIINQHLLSRSSSLIQEVTNELLGNYSDWKELPSLENHGTLLVHKSVLDTPYSSSLSKEKMVMALAEYIRIYFDTKNMEDVLYKLLRETIQDKQLLERIKRPAKLSGLPMVTKHGVFAVLPSPKDMPEIWKTFGFTDQQLLVLENSSGNGENIFLRSRTDPFENDFFYAIAKIAKEYKISDEEALEQQARKGKVTYMLSDLLDIPEEHPFIKGVSNAFFIEEASTPEIPLNDLLTIPYEEISLGRDNPSIFMHSTTKLLLTVEQLLKEKYENDSPLLLFSNLSHDSAELRSLERDKWSSISRLMISGLIHIAYHLQKEDMWGDMSDGQKITIFLAEVTNTISEYVQKTKDDVETIYLSEKKDPTAIRSLCKELQELA